MACLALVFVTAPPLSREATAQVVPAIVGAVEDVVRDDLDLDTVTIQVDGTEATLSGRVPTLWVKTQAIDRVLALDGVETVATELTIPEAENDDEIAQAVGSAIRQYRHNTIWDYVGASVVDGVVTLSGSVTPDRDKPAELFERVAKIRGVQDIKLELTRQSSSGRDMDLRTVIAQRVRRHPTFSQYAIMPDPPFRILVEEGVLAPLAVDQAAVRRS